MGELLAIVGGDLRLVNLAKILKKGIHLNMVHDLDRPFKELLLGLEGWIPLYMTGHINPYYFKGNTNSLYSHIECVSTVAALSGRCISKNIDNSVLIYTSKKDDIKYYVENSKTLLKKASPLMKIYTKEKKEDFYNFLDSNVSIVSKRENILLNLPNYILSDKLLNKIDILVKYRDAIKYNVNMNLLIDSLIVSIGG